MLFNFKFRNIHLYNSNLEHHGAFNQYVQDLLVQEKCKQILYHNYFVEFHEIIFLW